jgi:hypothetical protein
MFLGGADFAMPQPINRIVPNPHCYLDNNILADKPDLAILVTRIFATWAGIEQRLNFILVRVLGADAAPALRWFLQGRRQIRSGLNLISGRAAL